MTFSTAEDRIDFRELVRLLARRFSGRIEMRQVGVRDGASRHWAESTRAGSSCALYRISDRGQTGDRETSRHGSSRG